MKQKAVEWDDQPAEVRKAHFVTQFFAEGFVWQIRCNVDPDNNSEFWFVTAGNLFGSHTWCYGGDYRKMIEELGKNIHETKKARIG